MSDQKDQKGKAPLNAYKTAEILTANRETLLLMLYAGAIRNLKKAIDAVEKKDISSKAESLSKAQDIVTELRATLNHEAAADLAQNLDKLYKFVSLRMMQGNFENSVEPLREALEVMQNLSSAWEEAIASLKKERGK